jgi:hypothetical protein
MNRRPSRAPARCRRGHAPGCGDDPGALEFLRGSDESERAPGVGRVRCAPPLDRRLQRYFTRLNDQPFPRWSTNPRAAATTTRTAETFKSYEYGSCWWMRRAIRSHSATPVASLPPERLGKPTTAPAPATVGTLYDGGWALYLCAVRPRVAGRSVIELEMPPAAWSVRRHHRCRRAVWRDFVWLGRGLFARTGPLRHQRERSAIARAEHGRGVG